MPGQGFQRGLPPACDVAILDVHPDDVAALAPGLPIASRRELLDLTSGDAVALVGYPMEGQAGSGINMRAPLPPLETTSTFVTRFENGASQPDTFVFWLASQQLNPGESLREPCKVAFELDKGGPAGARVLADFEVRKAGDHGSKCRRMPSPIARSATCCIGTRSPREHSPDRVNRDRVVSFAAARCERAPAAFAS